MLEEITSENTAVNAFFVIIVFYFAWNVIIPVVYKVYNWILIIWGYKKVPRTNEFGDAACWMRLSVVIQVCLKEALLAILHDPTIGGLSRNKFDLHSALVRFKKLKEKDLVKEIKPYQWNIMCHTCTVQCPPICPDCGVAKSEDFDITCIIILIIHATWLPPPSGRQGWKQKSPNPLDTSKAAFILRARQLRNWIFHSSLCGQDSFEDKWMELEDILIGLAYQNMARFQDMKTASLDPFLLQEITLLKELYENLEEGKSSVADMSNVQDVLKKLQDIVTDLQVKIGQKSDQSEMQTAFQKFLEQKSRTERRFSSLEKNVIELTRRVEHMENQVGSDHPNLRRSKCVYATLFCFSPKSMSLEFMFSVIG